MNFSGEDRKEVFFFIQEILRSYKQPVYYENLRGHISKAPVNVRKYVLHKCKGDSFLEYFKRRKNYFNVENGKISLREEFGDEQLGNSHSNKSQKKSSKGKFVRRRYSYSSYAGALKGSDSNKNGDKEYESIAITYFRNRLIRKKKERLWAIEFMELPKKVKRHLQLYYKNNVKNFLCNYPDKFVIDEDNESVSLVHIYESNANAANSSTVNQESSTNVNQDFADNTVDSDVKKVSEYLECVVFFIDILKKLNQPFSIEKLGGYFSQARKEVKDHVKLNYRSFKFFFDDAPLIFLKNTSEEVSLSKEYRKLIKAAENLIKTAKDGSTLPSELPLKSCIDQIFHPQISSQHSSSCLEETDSNNTVLPIESMANTQEDLIDEMLKLGSRFYEQWEVSNESTDDFFDNYLMRSTSRESSNSLSSRSTRSTSVEQSLAEDCSAIKILESSAFKSNLMQDFQDMELTENAFVRYIFTVELFCLEFIESELNYIQSYENKAVEYFMKILDTSTTKVWKLNSLQGSIGNNREIAQFMNKLYKGEKFVSFFQNHPQFEVDPPFIKLALCDKADCDLTVSTNEKNVMKDLKDLYELSEFKILLKETYAYLYEVCKFCKDKSIKVDRLSGILARFISCLNMIKSLKGQSLHEKIEYFLRETMIFKFPENGSIFFPYDYFYKKCHILFAWFEKMSCYDPSEEFVCFSDFWKNNAYSKSVSNNKRKNSNGYINLEECYQNVANIVEDEMESRSEMNYYELSRIIPEYVLLAMINDNYYSKFIVSALLESRKFRMKNGKISLQRIDENYNSDNKDNVPTEIIRGFENHISEESSNELNSQQTICDSNLVNSSACSLSINSEDISKHSIESKMELEYCSNQSSDILETTDYCETDSNSVECKSNLTIKGDKVNVNPSLTFEIKNENFNSMNENSTSETFKKSILQDESKRGVNVHIAEENLCSEAPLTVAENFNSTEEIVECAKASKSIVSSKTMNSVEENESVGESSDKFCRREDKINGKIVSPPHNSDVLEEFNIPTTLLSPELHECEEDPKEKHVLLSMPGDRNLLICTDVSKQEDDFINDHIHLPSNEFNLETNYIISRNEDGNISVQPELEKGSLAKQNSCHEVSNENTAESNIKASKVEQNITFESKDKESAKFEVDLCNKQNKNAAESNIKVSKVEQKISFESKDKESAKLEIDLRNKQNSNDRPDAKTEMTKRELLNNLELANEGRIISTSEHSSYGNRNLDNCKASEQVEKESCHNDVPQVSDFNETKAKTKKNPLIVNKQNSNDRPDAKTEITKRELLDNLELANKGRIISTTEHSSYGNRNLDNLKAFEQVEKESSHNDVPELSDFNETKAQTKKIPLTVQHFKKSKELQGTIIRNVSTKQSFTYTPEELFDTSLMKQYLNSGKVSEDHPNMTKHVVESVKQNATKEVPFGYSSTALTSSEELKETNISRTSSYNDLSLEYPMQPIAAKIVLLTNNSCIALADIKKCKQNIYFSKYVFACEHQDDCADCFSVLQIGDEVSCFVPLPEISQKIWIAFMVTKDNSDNLNEFGIFEKLKENAQVICGGSTKSLSISAYIKNSTQVGCQTDFPTCDNYCQTNLSADTDLHKATKESSCQTSLVSAKHISVQTEIVTMTRGDQTDFKNAEIPLCRKCSKSQISFSGDSEKRVLTETTTSQASWHGKETPSRKNISCQTFSTGEIYMLNHHPM